MSELANFRVASGALILLGATACFRGSLPPLERYRLDLPDPPRSGFDSGPLSPMRAEPVIEGSIAIAPYAAPGIYGDPSIVYRIGESQYGSYPSREWALPLTLMLGQLTERVLAAQPLSTGPAVHSPPSRLAHPYEWQGTIREFEEVNRDRTVLVSVAFDVRLVRTADESIVWQGTEHVEQTVENPTMPAIVQALSESAAEVVTRLVIDARSALERSPPPPPGR